MLHAVAQQLRHAPGLILRGFDEQFVVHLQYQPRLEAALTHPFESRPEWDDLSRAPVAAERVLRTFCGT